MYIFLIFKTLILLSANSCSHDDLQAALSATAQLMTSKYN